MKTVVNLAIVAAALLATQFHASAQGTAFTYQGRLNDASGGGAANGYYDLAFGLFDAVTNGDQAGGTLTNLNTGVTNGLFTVTLDFGPGILTGSNLWLDISVRSNGVGSFTEMVPRQPLTATPYAVLAGDAAAYSGAVADSQLSGNIARLNANETFSGTVAFNSQSNTYDGSFTGSGAGLTDLQVSSIAGPVLTAIGWGYNNYGQATVPAILSGSNLVAIAAGNEHSLALKSDGTVAAWGLNGSGETNVPASLSGVIAIAAGETHSLALKSDGTVVGWGDNYYGESTPPIGLNDVVAVAAGENISLALKNNGTVAAWGNSPFNTAYVPAAFQSNLVAISVACDGFSALGLKNNGTVVAWNAAALPLGLSNVVAIASAGNGGMALKSDGTLVTWNLEAVPPSTNNITAIAASSFFSVALKSDGTLMAWGDNSYGETNVPTGSSNAIVAVAAGGLHGLALTKTGSAPARLARLDQVNVFTGIDSFSNPSDSFAGSGAGLNNLQVSSLVNQTASVVAWGNNGNGQTNVPAALNGSNIVGVAGGYAHSLALKSDGTVAAWGLNNDGQTNVPAGLNGVVAIAAGYYHSLALKSDGTVVAWGDNTYGELNVPIGLNNVVAVAGGQYTSMALKNDGTVAVWGNPNYMNIPASFQSNIVAISLFNIYSLALKNNGTVAAWYGPTPPYGLSNVVAVAATGNGGAVALKNDGTIVTWGGLLNSPTTNNVASIAAGSDFGVALKKDGTVTVWGDQSYNLTSYPVSLSGVISVAAGNYHVLALRGTGNFATARLAGLNQVNAFTGVNSFDNPANNFAGNGAGLTSLNASSLSSGTVADTLLSANVALLDGNQSFTGANTLGNASNVFAGAFSGDGGNLTNLNASQISSGMIPLAQLPGVVVTNDNAASVALSGLFTGVFSGDGRGLTNLPANAIIGGLTTNIAVVVPGGGTITLCFTNGILQAVQ
ncbi:MAG: hypothetical protein ABSG59_15000 [Verrucomicrobiota bacterium]|jgi:alpha-tubulin suppressor-like RCC1 family protein